MKKALVVDDSKVMRIGIKKMLVKRGYECEEAADGSAALAMLMNGHAYDIVCTDVHMPVMNGIELVRAIRSDVKFGGVPVLVISSDSDRTSIARALLAGADEYATKPLTEDALDDKLALLGL
jgi:two-component system chemotaxis response regulator CheY